MKVGALSQLVKPVTFKVVVQFSAHVITISELKSIKNVPSMFAIDAASPTLVLLPAETGVMSFFSTTNGLGYAERISLLRTVALKALGFLYK